MKNLPNLLSLLRLSLSPLVLIFSLQGNKEAATLLFVFLALSDALDGFLARVMGAETNFGKFVDPLADKVLLFFGLISVSFFTPVKVNPWVLKVTVLRDASLIGGTLILRKWGFIPEPSVFGKLTTLSISLLVLNAFILNSFPSGVLRSTLDALTYLSICLTIISWIDYGLKGIGFLTEKLIIEK